jgi:hypothetical protein
MANVMLSNASVLRVFMRQAPMDPEIWRRGSQHSQVLAEVFARVMLRHIGRR